MDSEDLKRISHQFWALRHTGTRDPGIYLITFLIAPALVMVTADPALTPLSLFASVKCGVIWDKFLVGSFASPLQLNSDPGWALAAVFNNRVADQCMGFYSCQSILPMRIEQALFALDAPRRAT